MWLFWLPIVNQPFFEKNALQVRDRLGPKLGFGGSLDLDSLQEIIGIPYAFRWGWISILDRSGVLLKTQIAPHTARTMSPWLKFIHDLSTFIPVDDELLTLWPIRTTLPPVFMMIHQPRAQQEPPRHWPRRQKKPQWNDGVVTERILKYWAFCNYWAFSTCNIRFLSVVMFSLLFFQKFWLPIGLHSSCSVRPTAGGTCQKCSTKHHDWVYNPTVYN